jgi:hypothetical protein
MIVITNVAIGAHGGVSHVIFRNQLLTLRVDGAILAGITPFQPASRDLGVIFDLAASLPLGLPA